MRELTARILAENGYRVIDAADGYRARILCDQFQGEIDLLLSDVVMPGMSGREVAEQLRTLRPDLKVLYMSGHAGDVLDHHGFAGAGAAAPREAVRPRPAAGERTRRRFPERLLLPALAGRLLVVRRRGREPAAGAEPRSRSRRRALTEHLRALDEIARRHGGDRAAGTPGYDASVRYVARRLRDVGLGGDAAGGAAAGAGRRPRARGCRSARSAQLEPLVDFRAPTYSGRGRRGAARWRPVGVGLQRRRLRRRSRAERWPSPRAVAA